MEASEYQLMDSAEDRMWWYRALHVRLLDQLLDTSGSLLDVGCGTGGFLTRLHADHPSVQRFGCELHEAAAGRAACKSGAPIVCGTAVALPFASMSFDYVVAADVLCHAAVAPERALIEMARVLRPNGRLVINMPAYQWLLSAHDRRVHNIRRATTRSLHSLLVGLGFRDIHTWYWNSLLLPIMAVQRKLRWHRAHEASDVRLFGSQLDAALYSILATERRLPFLLPFGGSVMATALRPIS